MTTRKRAPRRWSQRVTDTSNALDLDQDIFKKASPRAIARSLKRSAERSGRRKSPPFRSAMSMLTFYINRAGKNLPATTKSRLLRAKEELRDLYGRAGRVTTATKQRRKPATRAAARRVG
jgi:hypothetical protein